MSHPLHERHDGGVDDCDWLNDWRNDWLADLQGGGTRMMVPMMMMMMIM